MITSAADSRSSHALFSLMQYPFKRAINSQFRQYGNTRKEDRLIVLLLMSNVALSGGKPLWQRGNTSVRIDIKSEQRAGRASSPRVFHAMTSSAVRSALGMFDGHCLECERVWHVASRDPPSVSSGSDVHGRRLCCDTGLCASGWR
jgi:hypothetical protein